MVVLTSIVPLLWFSEKPRNIFPPWNADEIVPSNDLRNIYIHGQHKLQKNRRKKDTSRGNALNLSSATRGKT